MRSVYWASKWLFRNDDAEILGKKLTIPCVTFRMVLRMLSAPMEHRETYTLAEAKIGWTYRKILHSY